jgi:hypothetical protein
MSAAPRWVNYLIGKAALRRDGWASSWEPVQEAAARLSSAAASDVAVVIAALLSQFEKIREVRHAWRFSYESVELCLRLGQPLEHDVLLVPHFEQEIFDPREAVVDRAREGSALWKIVGLTVVGLCCHI